MPSLKKHSGEQVIRHTCLDGDSINATSSESFKRSRFTLRSSFFWQPPSSGSRLRMGTAMNADVWGAVNGSYSSKTQSRWLPQLLLLTFLLLIPFAITQAATLFEGVTPSISSTLTSSWNSTLALNSLGSFSGCGCLWSYNSFIEGHSLGVICWQSKLQLKWSHIYSLK